MLGTLDHSQLYGLLQALTVGDAPRLMGKVAQLAEQAPDWAGLLSELINLLHRIAIAQVVPDALDNGYGDREQLLELAQSLPPEDVQFYYQMALIGRRDLPLAPQPRGGFEMLLLRMLAFRPHDVDYAPPVTLSTQTQTQPSAQEETSPPPVEAEPIRQEEPPPIEQDLTVQAEEDQQALSSPTENNPADLAEHWQQLLPQLGLSGLLASIASHSTLAAIDGDNWLLHLDPAQPPLSEAQQQRLLQALEKSHGKRISLKIERHPPAEQTPAQRSAAQKQERLQQAELTIQQEPLVQALIEQFAAVIEPGSIQPID